jgi:dihydrolipoamide dehydrogenase
MADKSYDLIVIGGGPGGYVAAIRAAQLGMSVACIDKRSTLGGTCLNIGCIPSKALLQSSYKYVDAQNHFKDHGVNVKDVTFDLKQMMTRKTEVVESLTKGVQFLFKKYKVDFIEGKAKFKSANEILVNDKQSVQAKHVIIATGSEVANIPGVQIDEKQIVSSTGCLELKEVPEHLVVIGGGYIGLELGSVWQRLGAKVTVIEFLDRIVPNMDLEVGRALMRDLQKQGMEFILSSKVTQVKSAGKKKELTYEPAAGGKSETIQCDVILSSVGRKPYTEGLGLEAVGIKVDNQGRIPVDAQFRAGPGLYAIGDVIAGPMLAHKAEEEGTVCVEHIAGQKPHINYDAIPAVIYTHPEVASVGKTEEELKAKGTEYKIGKFPFTANARARTNGDTEGFVKILTNARTDEVLGVHIMHGEAGTMIAECALAMEYRASAEDIARTCHAHPTLSEAIKEAAMAAYDKPIHI